MPATTGARAAPPALRPSPAAPPGATTGTTLLASLEAAGAPALPRRFAAGEFVYARGESDRGLCVLLSGTIKVYKPYGNFREASVGLLKDDGIFGEPSPQPGGRHRDSAEALSPCLVAVVPKARLWAHLGRDPGCAVPLMLAFSEWATQREATIARLLMRGVGGRLACLLLELADRFGEEAEGDGGVYVGVRLTHHELADLVACTREAVSQEVGRLRRAGIVRTTTGGGYPHEIVVLDRRGLEEEARRAR